MSKRATSVLNFSSRSVCSSSLFKSTNTLKTLTPNYGRRYISQLPHIVREEGSVPRYDFRKILIPAGLIAVAVCYYADVPKRIDGLFRITDLDTLGALDGKIDPPTALNGNWREFHIASTEDLSPDTKRLRIKLWKRQTELGMPVASCVLTRVPPELDDEGKQPLRPYTPLTQSEDGHFDLVVKKYAEGVLSTYLHSLQAGDTIQLKGPFPKIKYTPNMKKHIGMLAGGTGITPMYQVIHAIVDNPEDNTQIDLIYSNKTDVDILLKSELDALALQYPNFRVHYVLTRETPEGWKGQKGHVTADMIKKLFKMGATGGDDTMVFVCGPPGFYKTVSGQKPSKTEQGDVSGLLEELGYTNSQVFKF